MASQWRKRATAATSCTQPVADGIKMLIKEDIVPVRADKLVHFLAPILIAAAAILALGVIPYGRNMTPFTIDGGILFLEDVNEHPYRIELSGWLGTLDWPSICAA